MADIAARLADVNDRIVRAARSVGRDPNSIRLVAVSKLQPAVAIRAAYAAGIRDFGENYAQELLRKVDELADLPDLRFHLIGHLQRNKARQVVRAVSVVHTVDTVELARELDKRAAQYPIPEVRRFELGRHLSDERLSVLVEINVGGEAQKSGCQPEALPEVLDTVQACPRLRLCGLMTVPPFSDQPADVRPFFDQVVALRDKHGGPARLPELSMGMTLDLEHAIAAGSTIVRVGTAIFGERAVREATS